MDLTLTIAILASAAFLRALPRLHAALLARHVRLLRSELIPMLESAYEQSGPEKKVILGRQIFKLQHEVVLTEAQYIRVVSKF